MNKSVLISIQPKYSELIAWGKKTIEVRKTVPKIQTPFKCYIYCTKGKERFITVFHKGEKVFCDDENSPTFDKTIIVKNPPFLNNSLWRQKVIGEFICDKIETIACHKHNNGVGFDYTYYTESNDTLTKEAQLTDYDMQQYLGCAEDGECVGYAWHISDLKIYDKPKELGEFKPYCNPNTCVGCRYFHNGASAETTYCSREPLKIPPQSWRYCNSL